MDKKAFYNIGYGLYVLTTNKNKDNGCIINTFIQVTSTPNRVALAVNKENFTCSELDESGVFNVSVIDESADLDSEAEKHVVNLTIFVILSVLIMACCTSLKVQTLTLAEKL